MTGGADGDAQTATCPSPSRPDRGVAVTATSAAVRPHFRSYMGTQVQTPMPLPRVFLAICPGAGIHRKEGGEDALVW